MRRQPEYIGYSDSTYANEARVMQSRITIRRARGKIVTSDMLWSWIKERRPGWRELDWEKVFQRVKL
jgi:hypothetical protein